MKKSGLLLFVFTCALFISGCVAMQESVETSDKDAKIKSLQEIIDDQQGQLRQLNDNLAACQARN
jgi:hypothetical protein